MNKDNHRLIFNASRSCMMAVAETATSCSKSPSGTSKARRKSSKCSKNAKSDGFNPSDRPLAQWARAQAAPDSGVSVAHNLRPGIALSEAQMAQLTSDIVWLVEQTITLPNGQTAQVLVPQVYVRVQPGDINGNGTLMAAERVNIELSSDLTNSGTIVGRSVMRLSADNVNNLNGRLQAADNTITATTDINNTGGVISANDRLQLNAGRDINVTTTTSSGRTAAGSGVYERTAIDRVAGLYISNPGGTLLASAGRDIKLTAAVVQNQGVGGITVLDAKRDLNLASMQTRESSNITFDAKNYSRFGTSQEIGTQIQTTGNVALRAGQDITTRAATVNSTEGTAAMTAGRDVNLTAGQSSLAQSNATFTTGRAFLSKSSKEDRSSSDSTNAQASQIGGVQIVIDAGRDITVRGSEVISDKSTTLVAGNNINIESATNTANSTSFSETKTKGLFSSGGGLTFGKKQQSTDQKDQTTTAAASTVGSIGGNVNLIAGQTFKQVGSDVVAPKGDINILAKDVQIIEARETSASQTETKAKQSGLTVGISSSVISGIQGVQSIAQAAGNTSSGRMRGLAVASAAMTINSTANSIGDAASALGKGDLSGGASLNISVGSSKSQSNTTAQSDTAKGSTVAAGGNVNITATNPDKLADRATGQPSNILIQGSEVKAGGSATLAADNEVNLLAAKNTSSQVSTNSSSSGSIGVSISAQGVSATASASKSKGKSDGQDLGFTNSQISAGNTASIISGGDTNIKGAVVTANQIKADIGQQFGGNLNIESLQDTSTYTSSQRSSGFSVSVPITGSGSAGGSVNASRSNINSNFQSVGEQSGLKAGDGGFQVSVANSTALTGGVIASTQAAVDSKANTFTTGGALTTTDVQNTASFTGKAVGGTIGMGSQLGSSGAGVGNMQGSAASTSAAGITGIAGNTAVRTGDAETGIKPIFDAGKVQREINAQVAITQAFGQQAVPAWGSYANDKFAAAVKAGDEQAIKCWGPDGACRAGGHMLIGGLTGGVGGALGAGVSSVAAPHVQGFLIAQGIPLAAAQALTQLSAIGMGATVGGVTGTAAGFNESSGNAVLAIPWLVESIIVGGPLAARACLASPACQKALYLGGATVFAAVAAIATPPLASNNTGNTTPPPNYGGATVTPITASPDTNSTTSPADQPRPVVTTDGSVAPAQPSGSTVVGGGFAASPQPVFNPLTMAVPPNLLGSDGKLLPGIDGTGTPIPMPPTNNPNTTAEDFARNAFNGQTPTNIKTDLVGPGSWLATLPNGTTVLYRPAGQGTKTDAGTSSVDINSSDIRTLNGNLPAKFKLPKS